MNIFAFLRLTKRLNIQLSFLVDRLRRQCKVTKRQLKNEQVKKKWLTHHVRDLEDQIVCLKRDQLKTRDLYHKAGHYKLRAKGFDPVDHNVLIVEDEHRYQSQYASLLEAVLPRYVDAFKIIVTDNVDDASLFLDIAKFDIVVSDLSILGGSMVPVLTSAKIGHIEQLLIVSGAKQSDFEGTFRYDFWLGKTFEEIDLARCLDQRWPNLRKIHKTT